MFDHDPFGQSSGAGGKQDIGSVIGLDGNIRIGGWSCRANLFPLAVHRHDMKTLSQVKRLEALLGEDDGHTGFPDHVAQPLSRILWIQRYIGSSGLENPQQYRQQFNTALHADAHRHIRSDAMVPQGMSQLISPFVKLAISQRLVFKYHRYCAWGLFCLLFKELVDALVFGVFGRSVIDRLDKAPQRLLIHLL